MEWDNCHQAEEWEACLEHQEVFDFDLIVNPLSMLSAIAIINFLIYSNKSSFLFTQESLSPFRVHT